MRYLIAAALLGFGLNAADRLTIGQAIDIREPFDLQYSPDGERVAVAVQEAHGAKPAQRHIWVYERVSRELRQWTNSPKSESSPRWSSDGRMLAFLSNRGEGNQIWLMPVNGGEAMELTSAKNSVEKFRWSFDGKRIAYLAPDPRTPEEERKQRDQDDSQVMDEPHPTRIWTVDVSTKAVRRVTSGEWHFRDLAWMPDGAHVLAIGTSRPADEHRALDRLCSVSLSDGSVQEILAPKGPFKRFSFSEGLRGGVCRVFERWAHRADLFILPLDTRVPRNLTAAKDRPVAKFQWMSETELAAVFYDGFHTTLEVVGAVPRKLVSNEALRGIDFHHEPSGVGCLRSGIRSHTARTLGGRQAGQSFQRRGETWHSAA